QGAIGVQVGPDIEVLVADRERRAAALPKIIGELGRRGVAADDHVFLYSIPKGIILEVHFLLERAAVARVLVILLGRGQLVAVVKGVGPGLGRAALAFLYQVALIVICIAPRSIARELVAGAGGVAAVGAVARAVEGQVVGAVGRQLVGVVIAVRGRHSV